MRSLLYDYFISSCSSLKQRRGRTDWMLATNIVKHGNNTLTYSTCHVITNVLSVFWSLVNAQQM